MQALHPQALASCSKTTGKQQSLYPKPKHLHPAPTPPGKQKTARICKSLTPSTLNLKPWTRGSANQVFTAVNFAVLPFWGMMIAAPQVMSRDARTS